MNQKNMNLIIQNYIDDFERLKAGENYKWQAVKHFQDNWDIDDENFSSMFKYAFSKTINLIDTKYNYPGAGIVFLASQEMEVVRELFRELFADDNGDIIARKDRIDYFISQTDQLFKIYAPNKERYKQDVRTVISYLFFRFPDENYLYKSTEAHRFADYIEFVHDIGNGRSFKLEYYYKMCDQILAAINSNEQLITINKSRFNDSTWQDSSNHLLTTDMIFCAPNYTLFRNLEPPKKTKKVVLEKDSAIWKSELKTNIENIKDMLVNIQSERSAIMNPRLSGVIVHHKNFGAGEIVDHNHGKNTIIVRFKSGEKVLGLPDVFTKKIMTTEDNSILDYYNCMSELTNEENRRSVELKALEIKLKS